MEETVRSILKNASVSVEIYLNVADRYIVNSNGIDGGYSNTMVRADVLVFSNGTNSSYGFESQSATFFQDIDPEHIGRESANYAKLSRKHKKNVENGERTIIFDPHAVAQLIYFTVVSSACADTVQRGESPFKGLLGEQIGANSLTVLDDPTIIGGTGSRPFDAEGVPSHKIHIIANGRLKNYLHNSHTACRFNTTSNGHAERDFRSAPYVNPTNILVESGSVDSNEMMNSTEKGLFVKEMLTNRPSIKGDFLSVVTSGFNVEGGQITTPVRQCMIFGNVKEVFKGIDTIGRTLKKEDDAYLPPIKFSLIKVVGN